MRRLRLNPLLLISEFINMSLVLYAMATPSNYSIIIIVIMHILIILHLFVP